MSAAVKDMAVSYNLRRVRIHAEETKVGEDIHTTVMMISARNIGVWLFP